MGLAKIYLLGHSRSMRVRSCTLEGTGMQALPGAASAWAVCSMPRTSGGKGFRVGKGCVVSTQGRPVHLWDALSGQLRASYRAYNAVDEVTAAYCLAFSSDGGRILAGFNKALRIFDVGRPGRAYTEVVTHKRDAPGLQGARLSALRAAAMPAMCACAAGPEPQRAWMRWRRCG